jgi:carboxyl-terminal processing protease
MQTYSPEIAQQIHDKQQTTACRRRFWGFWRVLALCVGLVSLVFASFGAGVATMWAIGPELRRTVAAVAPGVVDTRKQQTREQRIGLLWEVWDILQAEYLNPQTLDDQKMIYGAVAGAVGTLGDPHTAFVEPAPAALMEEDMQGSFEGIGATVDMVDGRVVIVRPLPNSPALKAGLQAGDIVLAVDDQSLEGRTLAEAIGLIRGPRGTVARLRVLRKGSDGPFIVPVTRARVELPIVESRMLEGRIAYLRLAEFNALSGDRLHTALEELMGSEPTGLVLDLRGNPGGYLQMAIDIASEFLPRGTVVVAEQERGRERQEVHVQGRGLALDVPLVVLVDGASASASEIVAGAIRDSGRGKLVGEKTYGKGSVQNTHRLEDGSSLRVTIAKWYLPKGQHLDGNGIEPDIVVTVTQEDVSAGTDPQLDRAIAYLQKGE